MKISDLSLKLAFLLLFQVLTANVSLHAQGLRFKGLEETIENRTSYDVFNGKCRHFKDEMNINCQVFMYPEARFGYLLRIKEKNDNRVWNLLYEADSYDDPVILRFNEEGSESLIKVELDRQYFPEQQWVDLMVQLDFVNNKVMLSVSGQSFAGELQMTKRDIHADIVFGVSDYIIDLPSFALRCLTVSDIRGSESFPFTESEGNSVHNSRLKVVGSVCNPIWMIRNSSQWTKMATMSLPSNAGYCYDKVRRCFYYFDKTSIYCYSLIENTITRKEYANVCPVNIDAGCNVLMGDEIIYYEPCGHMKSKRTALAALDVNTLGWRSIAEWGVEKQIYHHTGFVNPSDSSYYIFGGYGNMKYNGNFYKISKETHGWRQVWQQTNMVCPRYFVSSGTDDRYAYFFGGMGNSSGEQVVGRKYFYDFYRANLQTGQMELMWTLPNPQSHYVPVRSMIIDEGYAYTLCYPEYRSDSKLSLHRYRISDGGETVLDETVDICSDKLFTNAMLYLDKDMEKLFVVTQEFDNDISSTLNIYQINWPVMFQNYTFEDAKRSRIIKMASVIPVALVLLTFIIVVLVRRRHRLLEQSYKRALANKEHKLRVLEKMTPNSIHLFGQFQVIDDKGHDISGIINGQQRDIFLLIAKYSGGKGISSERLSKIIWPDKEEEKVKNSRCVAINKLRSSLSSVKGLSIVYEGGSYIMTMEDNRLCDYLAFEDLMSDSNPDMKALLDIAGRGKFVAFSENPIFDSWKARVEDKLSSLLHSQIQKCFDSHDWAAVMAIADVLFAIDPLDEQVLQYAIRSLKYLRHSEDALVRYADFNAEYRAVNGEDYPVPFSKI